MCHSAQQGMASLEMPHRTRTFKDNYGLRPLMTGTQPMSELIYLNLNVKFQTEVSDLIFVFSVKTLDIYQNSYKGTDKTFIPQH